MDVATSLSKFPLLTYKRWRIRPHPVHPATHLVLAFSSAAPLPASMAPHLFQRTSNFPANAVGRQTSQARVRCKATVSLTPSLLQGTVALISLSSLAWIIPYLNSSMRRGPRVTPFQRMLDRYLEGVCDRATPPTSGSFPVSCSLCILQTKRTRPTTHLLKVIRP